MALSFTPIVSDEDIKRLASMASDIWYEYWPGKLSYEQVDYMVDRFQSKRALTKDINEEGYEYWFLEEAGRRVGYTGGRAEPKNDKFFISKIYLYDSYRGRGFGSEALRFYEQLCRERGLSTLYLTVNKYNDLGINAYKARGYMITESVVTSIGDGFVMDDYIMEKQVQPE